MASADALSPDFTMGLPDRTLQQVMKHLPVATVYGKMAHVCRRWRRIANTSSIRVHFEVGFRKGWAAHARGETKPDAIERSERKGLRIALHPDGRVYGGRAGSSTISVWRDDYSPLPDLLGHGGLVYALVLSPDGKRLCSGSVDKTIRIWDAETNACLHTLTGHTGRVMSLAMSPDGDTVYSGSEDSTIRAWSMVDGSHLTTLTGHTQLILSLAVSPDGQQLCSGSNGFTIRVWSLADGSHIRTLTGHTGTVKSLVFSPDGGRLYSGSDDFTIWVWNTVDGAHLKTLNNHTDMVLSLALSSNGRWLFSGSYDKTIRVWDTTDNTLTATINTTQYAGNSVTSLALSSDGQLVSGSVHGPVLCW